MTDYPPMRNETLTCEGCVRPRNLGRLCSAGEPDYYNEPCFQKVTDGELEQGSFGEICAWCNGLCCYSGVSCRELISDETLASNNIVSEKTVPCAARDATTGCRLPRECRPRPCLMFRCGLVEAIALNPEMWQYCKAHGTMVAVGEIVCKDCPFWPQCSYEKKTLHTQAGDYLEKLNNYFIR